MSAFLILCGVSVGGHLLRDLFLLLLMVLIALLRIVWGCAGLIGIVAGLGSWASLRVCKVAIPSWQSCKSCRLVSNCCGRGVFGRRFAKRIAWTLWRFLFMGGPDFMRALVFLWTFTFFLRAIGRLGFAISLVRLMDRWIALRVSVLVSNWSLLALMIPQTQLFQCCQEII